MSMEDLIEGIQLTKKFESDFVGRQSELLISSAEVALGITFPLTYKKFLLELGCGNIGCKEFYGIINEDFYNSGIPDAVWITMQERRDSELPQPMVIVCNDGMGNYHVIDTAVQNQNGENPIKIWTPGVSGATNEMIKIADDFGIFFLKEVREVCYEAGK